MSSKYEKMTLVELKEELRKRNAKLSGRKKDLIDRLQFYDRNFASTSTSSDVNDTFNMKTPDPLAYKDVNSDSKIPKLTEDLVQAYFDIFDHCPRQKAEDMYTGRFLQSVRYSPSDDGFFFKGRVSAEMKKSCSYIVDISMDKHAVVQQAQCECAAGQGPQAHCKHVSLVLFALTKHDTGILTKETCTQSLQSFHKAKHYHGSPVKMPHLKIRNSVTFEQISSFDPRPQNMCLMPEYPSLFRSVWLNCPTEDLPIRQLYEPANIAGVFHDHAYMPENKQHEELFLQGLHVTSITPEIRSEIELETRGQSKNKNWLSERTKRIHSSNFGRICNATDRTNFTELATSLTRIQSFTSLPTNHGRQYEEVALKAYVDKTGNTVNRCGINVSESIPFLACSPDGFVDVDGIVEIKCPYVSRNFNISSQTVPYLQHVSASGEFQLKENHIYSYQVQGTLLCSNRKWCDFVVWTFCDMQIIRIERNEEFITSMVDKLTDFYNSHFRSALLRKFLYRN